MEHLFQPGKGDFQVSLRLRRTDHSGTFTEPVFIKAARKTNRRTSLRFSRTQTSRWLIHLDKSNKPYMSRSPQSQFHPTFSTSGWGQTLWRFKMPPKKTEAVKLQGQSCQSLATTLALGIPILRVTFKVSSRIGAKCMTSAACHSAFRLFARFHNVSLCK